MSDSIWDVRITDTSLRDGSHHKRHQFTLDEVGAIVAALDAAGVPVIEVTHGDGLGGSSVNYGFPAHTDEEYLSTVIPLMKQAKVSALLLPGIGTVDHLRMVAPAGNGLEAIRIQRVERDVDALHTGRAQALRGPRKLCAVGRKG